MSQLDPDQVVMIRHVSERRPFDDITATLVTIAAATGTEPAPTGGIYVRLEGTWADRPSTLVLELTGATAVQLAHLLTPHAGLVRAGGDEATTGGSGVAAAAPGQRATA